MTIQKTITPIDNSVYLERPLASDNDINQVLEKSKQLNHHPEIFISHVDVRIMLHTADLGQITELDLKFSKFISDVYDDTKFIRDF